MQHAGFSLILICDIQSEVTQFNLPPSSPPLPLSLFLVSLSSDLEPAAEREPSQPCLLSKLVILEGKHHAAGSGVRDFFWSDLLFTEKGNYAGCRGWKHAAKCLLFN